MNESQNPKAVDWSARIGLSTAIYSVSAAFVLFGIYRLSKGTLNGSLVLPKCLCLGSLSLYETAMLASVGLLVLGRALKDEAVCLVVLLGVLLGANAVVGLSVTGSPGVVIGFGSLSFGLCLGIVWTLSQQIKMALSKPAMIGVCLLQGLSLGLVPILNWALDEMIEVPGWTISFLAVEMLLAFLILAKLKELDPKWTPAAEEVPLLESRGFGWAWVLLIALGGVVQIWLLSWIYIKSGSLCAFALAMLLLLLIASLSELCRRHKDQSVLEALGVGIGCLILFSQNWSQTPGLNLIEKLGSPWLQLLLCGVLCGLTAWRCRLYSLAACSLGCLIGAFCLSGGAQATGRALPWETVFCVLAVVAWAALLWCRRSIFAIVAIFLALLALGNAYPFPTFCYEHGFSVLGALFGLYSVLICLTWLRCRDKLDANWAWSGVIGLILCNCCGPLWSNAWSALPSLACVIFAVLLWRLAAQKIMAAALAASLFVPLIRSNLIGDGWLLIFSGFGLLALGLKVSLRPKDPDPEPPSATTENDQPPSQSDDGANQPLTPEQSQAVTDFLSGDQAPTEGSPAPLKKTLPKASHHSDRRASPTPPEPGYDGLISVAKFLIIGFIILAVLVAMLLPAMGGVREKSNVTKCKGSLKQIGLVMQSYFSDGTSTAMPILKSFEVSASNDGGFGFDANMLQCCAARHDESTHYVWNPKVSGSTWSIWNNPNSALIWDASPHRVNGKINAVFGDGHVEEISVEMMQEMMR
jgi:prepilin-type processing-associated H-X9-DG protein